uniref:Uncharacterized protein n=1 Tax=Setaria italica TaxID=4555 RepID=K4AN97_SETIT
MQKVKHKQNSIHTVVTQYGPFSYGDLHLHRTCSPW